MVSLLSTKFHEILFSSFRGVALTNCDGQTDRTKTICLPTRHNLDNSANFVVTFLQILKFIFVSNCKIWHYIAYQAFKQAGTEIKPTKYTFSNKCMPIVADHWSPSFSSQFVSKYLLKKKVKIVWNKSLGCFRKILDPCLPYTSWKFSSTCNFIT